MPASLSAILETAFTLLSEGVADPASPFRTPTLASIGIDGTPALRTIVLRAFDPACRRLAIHTDIRSAKFAELSAIPRAALHGWDAPRRVQIRVRGSAALHVGNDAALAAWARLSPASKGTYCVTPGPGIAIAKPHDTHAVDETVGFSVFCLIFLVFDELEWLQLEHGGHNRAKFCWDDGVLAPRWLVP